MFYAGRLRRRSESLELTRNGTTLVLAPHPDDEALGCGALLARRAASGSNTVVAYFTDGEGSHRGHPTLRPADLAVLRRAEALDAMASIGIPGDRLRFCGAPDGKLKSLSPSEIEIWVARLKDLVVEVRPAEVMLPCRDDGSSEHEAVFTLLRRALAALPFAAPRILEFPVWSWWSPRLLSRVVKRPGAVWRQPVDEYAESKRGLLRRYPSQTLPVLPFNKPMLSRQFVSAFETPVEYFIESPPN